MNISKTLPSSFEVIPSFTQDVLENLSKEITLEGDEIFNIKLVLEESMTNAIKHGNKLNPSSMIQATVSLAGNRLTMIVKDQGQGFDFKNVPDPTQRDHLLKTSGRGVFLIRKLMDDVSYHDGGREIRMVKVLCKNKSNVR